MTDKKKRAKASMKLSNTGFSWIIRTLKKRADEQMQSCRERPCKVSTVHFKEAYSDLLELLKAYLNQNPEFASTDISEDCDDTYNNVGRLVAYAEAIGVKSPDAFKDLVRKYDFDFPLDFLCGIEALRSANPKLNFEVTRVQVDDEIPF